jgi:hypothetical protein
VRLKNIHLGNALKKLEATLRSKEQLAGAVLARCLCGVVGWRCALMHAQPWCATA